MKSSKRLLKMSDEFGTIQRDIVFTELTKVFPYRNVNTGCSVEMDFTKVLRV